MNNDEFNNLFLLNSEYEQLGGNNNYLYQYLKYKLKYLELKYNLVDHSIQI